MRYNIFNSIHKALKAICYENALEIQRTDFPDLEEAEKTIENLEKTLALLDMHFKHESDFIHPLLEKVDMDIDRRFREKHIESRFLAEKARIAAKDFAFCHSENDRIQKGKLISDCFEALLAFNLTLFIKEEQVLNQMLWGSYSDEEIMAVEQQIIASVPEDILELETVWMMRSLNNSEISKWLLGIRETAPGPVFESLLSLARKELPGARFEKLLTVFSMDIPNEYAHFDEHTVLNIF
ncbi:hypothetical protein [Dyadobacter crusticola]|uniref:hypothetical protein n=1 Tax=Dyadobacter crusticola TaxID=292407 RepID=UPI0004E20EE5|nr:hypothetical protein [Dyadobacter crusticola]